MISLYRDGNSICHGGGVAGVGLAERHPYGIPSPFSGPKDLRFEPTTFGLWARWNPMWGAIHIHFNNQVLAQT